MCKNKVRINVQQIERIKDKFIYFLRSEDIYFWESFRDKDINYFYQGSRDIFLDLGSNFKDWGFLDSHYSTPIIISWYTYCGPQ